MTKVVHDSFVDVMMSVSRKCGWFSGFRSLPFATYSLLGVARHSAICQALQLALEALSQPIVTDLLTDRHVYLSFIIDVSLSFFLDV